LKSSIVSRQRLEAHRDAPRIAGDVFIREREAVVRHELDRLRRDLPEPHLRPREIGYDRHPPARRALDLADAPDEFRAVRKIEPRE
jgi:hypothetical protein